MNVGKAVDRELTFIHTKEPTIEKVYVCKQHEKAVIDKLSLQQEQILIVEQPQVCNHCGWAFIQAPALICTVKL